MEDMWLVSLLFSVKLPEVTFLKFVKPETHSLLLPALIFSNWAALYCWVLKDWTCKLPLEATLHVRWHKQSLVIACQNRKPAGVKDTSLICQFTVGNPLTAHPMATRVTTVLYKFQQKKKHVSAGWVSSATGVFISIILSSYTVLPWLASKLFSPASVFSIKPSLSDHSYLVILMRYLQRPHYMSVMKIT